jgi:hypothetical protein
MSSLDDILAGMDAWSKGETYKKPAVKKAPPPQKPEAAPPPPKPKVLVKRKIDQYYEKLPVPESEKQKKAKTLIQNLIKPKGNLKK